MFISDEKEDPEIAEQLVSFQQPKNARGYYDKFNMKHTYNDEVKNTQFGF